MSILILLLVLTLVAGAAMVLELVRPVLGDSEQQCVLFSSTEFIHITTGNVGGCNWLVAKLMYNGSGFNEVQYDREVYISSMLGNEFRYTIGTENVETWILTKK